MAGERVDPLRAEIERLAKEWGEFLSPFAESKVEKTLQECAFALRAALAAPAPEPQGWGEIERLVDAARDAAFSVGYWELDDGEEDLFRRREADTAARRTLLRALRASVQGGGK